jgi:hypothetical protein
MSSNVNIIGGVVISFLFLVFHGYFFLICVILEQKLLIGDFNKEFLVSSVYINHLIKLLCVTGSIFVDGSTAIANLILFLLGIIYFLNYINMCVIKPVFHNINILENMQLISAMFLGCLMSFALGFSDIRAHDHFYVLLVIPLFYKLIADQHKNYFAYILEK